MISALGVSGLFSQVDKLEDINSRLRMQIVEVTLRY
jgi:hypothetical protein